jgi:hypothetical protein
MRLWFRVRRSGFRVRRLGFSIRVKVIGLLILALMVCICMLS